ncbi:molecular chaperone Hsp33 [Mycobacterium sp. KBS0706]|uniref:Hsp33 family molecular chaperone HslO n=1 Tax=Mycobacterium sp. KBS0706 TaxID=2578109 RepID=UPI00110F9E86|nr:Hsp33 family molecular chaperone HslO [Mycobacterium sp. KBS0706]TSD86362.1 molecular chaperone Hsp33 [Mycobacterium sp. KBS0706]
MAVSKTGGDDLILPFQIEASGLRGRLVRFGPLLDEILGRHAYPEPVAHLLAETVVLTALLASALKYEGVFTLQAKGDGPVRLVVADVTTDGAVRANAMFDEARLTGTATTVPALLGRGHLAFTVDQGQDTERYQGIVDLSGETLWECAQHYFRQSEQLQAGLRSAVRHGEAGWRGGGIMLQRLPDPEKQVPTDREDDWRRAMVLLGSATDDELTQPALSGEALLFRLYNEDGVRVFPSQPMRFSCRCSRERVASMLKSMPKAEIEGLAVDGRVEVACEFCNTRYDFDRDQLAALYAA